MPCSYSFLCRSLHFPSLGFFTPPFFLYFWPITPHKEVMFFISHSNLPTHRFELIWENDIIFPPNCFFYEIDNKSIIICLELVCIVYIKFCDIYSSSLSSNWFTIFNVTNLSLLIWRIFLFFNNAATWHH